MKTITLKEAAQQLDALADQALQGQAVLISKEQRLLILKEFQPFEPIPERPLGYFDDCYDENDIEESNSLAEQSVKEMVP
jgi:hypothetical protein